MNIVTFKILQSDGKPGEGTTELATGLSGELQPAGVPVRELEAGDAEADYFDLYSDSYVAGVKRGDFVKTLDGSGDTIDTYKIIDVSDYGDQLDLKLRKT